MPRGRPRKEKKPGDKKIGTGKVRKPKVPKKGMKMRERKYVA